MQKDYVKEYRTKNNRFVVFQDDDTESPRRSQDNLGTFVFYHQRYAYGDINNPKPGTEENQRIVEDLAKPHEKIPVYMIDHSGIGFSTGSFNDKWDSGQAGYIYITHDKIKNEFGLVTPEIIEKVREALKMEIKELDLYSRGYTYGWSLYELNTCPHCNVTNEIEIENGYGYITDKPEELLNYACDNTMRNELLKGEIK